MMNNHLNSSKNLTELLVEMKHELRDFVQTRITMLKVELQEKAKTLKTAAPIALIGILLLLTAYLLFTLAVVALVFGALPDNAYRWCLAFVAVAVLWSLLGGVAVYFAKRELEVKGLLPRRTVEVLREDKLWIESEVRQVKSI
jgi:uncharacterized membrane protein YqjE